MFTRVSQKLVPALVDRSRSTPLTAMMSSLSVSSQPKHVALRSPHNMFCHGYSRLSFDFPSAASVFRGSSSFQPELMSSRGFTEARLAKSLISDASTPIIKPNGLLQARGFASKKVGSIFSYLLICPRCVSFSDYILIEIIDYFRSTSE